MIGTVSLEAKRHETGCRIWENFIPKDIRWMNQKDMEFGEIVLGEKWYLMNNTLANEC